MQSFALLRLAAVVFAGVSLVVSGDVAGKLLTLNGLEPIMVAWTRLVIGVVVVLPFSGLKLSELHSLRDWRVLLRAACITNAIFCIQIALLHEPVANVFGALFIAPLISFILSMIFLGEKPSRTRAILLGLGFIGVLLVVKPGFGASFGMVYGIAAGMSYGGYLMLTRVTSPLYRPRLLLMTQLIVGSIVVTPLGIQATLPDMDPITLLLILISALTSAAGNLLLAIANRNAEASLIAPLVYTQLITATVLGIIVFNDWPDTYSFAGLTLIAVSGLASLRDHHKQQTRHSIRHQT